MDRRGIALKVVALDSGIPYPTLATYFPADPAADPSQISGGAIYALAEGKALPGDLLSLLMPEGWAIVQVPAQMDHNDIAPAFNEYLSLKNDCHHPESECGPAIGPKEQALLDAKVVQLPLMGRVA